MSYVNGISFSLLKLFAFHPVPLGGFKTSRRKYFIKSSSWVYWIILENSTFHSFVSLIIYFKNDDYRSERRVGLSVEFIRVQLCNLNMKLSPRKAILHQSWVFIIYGGKGIRKYSSYMKLLKADYDDNFLCFIKISFSHENNKEMWREDNLRVDFHVDTTRSNV